MSELRTDREIAGATVRFVRALGWRLAEADPEDLALLGQVRAELDRAYTNAIGGLRENFSDAQIGEALGITRQAVRQRWPHRQAVNA